MEKESSEDKWKVLDTVIKETEMIEQLEDPSVSVKLEEILKKLNQVKQLNDKVEKDQEKLKKEYIFLLKERNIFFDKFQRITAIGNNLEWKDSNGILEKIASIFNGQQDSKDSSA